MAGSAGILILGTLGCWFFMVERLEFATVAFATAGSIAAFLRYNITPAKIFMGDTGSLLIGMVTAILTIKFIDLGHMLAPENPFRFKNIPVVAIGIIILPLFDTLRVFITRIIRNKSPFKPDRRHIHHLLIDYGFSHLQATGILVFLNAGFIVFVFTFHDTLSLHTLLLAILCFASLLTLILHRAVRSKNQNTPPNPIIE